jgi:hypothetical protein
MNKVNSTLLRSSGMRKTLMSVFEHRVVIDDWKKSESLTIESSFNRQ